MNKTKIFCVCNQKGGCGKTTISMHLAGEIFLNKNVNCVVVDADEQNSALGWFSLNKEKKLPFSVVDYSKAGIKLHEKIFELGEHFQYIIIDCPPAANSEITTSALMVSDVALIPFVSSGVDMLALIMLYKKLQQITLQNSKLQSRIILNLLEDRTQNTKKILNTVKEFNIPILQSTIKKRTIFKDAILEGTLIQFLKKKDKDALMEIQKMGKEILLL